MNIKNNKTRSSSGVIATTLTNPGIIDRLEQDIQDYLHEFGFRIEREWNDVEETPRKDKAVIFIPSLPYSIDECISQRNCTSSYPGPTATLHLHVSNESLLPTVGPLLRTLLRLAVHIPPQSLRAILYCDFTLDPLQKLSKMSTVQRQENLRQQEEIAAKKMVNAVHMLVRNSMGSALCLDMIIMLPCYYRRRNSDHEDVKESLPLSKFAVDQEMKNNHDSNYPSIHIEERANSKVIFNDGNTNIVDGSRDSSTMQLSVSTRMCTVRHQPLLFRWLCQIGGDKSVHDTEGAARSILSSQMPLINGGEMPLIVACVEKPGNLHRILMLCHQYLLHSSSILSRLVVVMPDDDEERTGLKKLFQGAMDHFREAILEQDDASDQCCLPVLVYDCDAVAYIQSRLNRHKSENEGSETSHQEPSIIGIDLHPNALTLSVSNHAAERSQAETTLGSANAIIFGYESTGIPRNIDDMLLNRWVQIPSRSSINLVAAMSIIFDAMFNTS